jgi:hypothetical protein
MAQTCKSNSPQQQQQLLFANWTLLEACNMSSETPLAFKAFEGADSKRILCTAVNAGKTQAI